MALNKDNGARFYGVYLLCSQSHEKRYKGKCYIGFTVNPNRRINQHNRGKEFGGAHKTSNKGPWLMVMIVHGFPNNIAALQFEWAWQQPTLSSRLKNYPELRRKAPKETYIQYNFRILCRMLQVGPWNRLPLIIRWLETDYEQYFDLSNLPPSHMKIISGNISTLKSIQSSKRNAVISSQSRTMWAHECHLCMQEIECPERARIGCLVSTCKLTCHIICLANHLIAADSKNRGHYIPISGLCPLCETQLTWAALLQRRAELQLCDAGITASKVSLDDEQSHSDDDSIGQLIDCISDEECELYEISE